MRVQTLDRVVYLYGLVHTDLERELAEQVATKPASGARIIDSIAVNNLASDPPPRRSFAAAIRTCTSHRWSG